jgi:crossover junction endodeoxyribonuclease RusA
MLEVFVAGNPAPQGSKRHVGNGRMIESSKRLHPWRSTIAAAVRFDMLEGALAFRGAVVVTLDFVMPRPVSTPKRFTPPAVKRPDIDKLARACLDAITGIAIRDDSQVVELVATKRIAEIAETPGVLIRIAEPSTDTRPDLKVDQR